MFHYFENFSPDDQNFNDFCHSQKSNSFLISGISDYDFEYNGDLFSTPESIIEQPLIPMCVEDTFFPENKFTYLESLEDNDFMSNYFEEYEDTLAKETWLPTKFPDIETDYSNTVKEILHPFGKFTKSVSSESLRPISMNFTEMEMENVHGMRRVCSEGYIKPQVMSDQIQETRMQKLSRYRDKKTKRKFGRKIKYACRKALADGQPRIKGRFA